MSDNKDDKDPNVTSLEDHREPPKLATLPTASSFVDSLPKLTRSRLEDLAEFLDLTPEMVIRVVVAEAYESMLGGQD